MRGYEGDEYDEYLDEYEDEGEDQYEEEGGEEEYEEEEAQPPSQELLEYLELRQRLKEDIRKQRKKELGGGSRDIKKNALPRDNFGSFFGPSQPVISQRVIQESKSLLENPNLAAKVIKANHSSTKSSASKPAGSKTTTSDHAPKVKNGLKRKIEMVKNTRDYSFLLSDDTELPGPSKGPLTHKVSAPNYDARSVQRPGGMQSSSNTGRKLQNDREAKRGSQIPPKAGIQKSMSINKPAQPTLDSRKQFGSSNGSGPGRPVASKGVPPKVAGNPNDKSSVPALHRSTPSKLQPSVLKQSSVQSRVPVESGNSKVMSKQGVPVSRSQVAIQKQPVSSSRPQIKPPPPRSVDRSLEDRRPSLQRKDDRRPSLQRKDDRRPSLQQKDERRPTLQQKDERRPALQQRGDERRRALQQRDERRPALQQRDDRRPAVNQKDDRRPPSRKPTRYDEDDDGVEAISMIRKMFGYNPNRYRDEDDDSDMEANFDEILKEERRSAKIARKEDEEELRKIEEEERRERMRKAKKRKLQ